MKKSFILFLLCTWLCFTISSCTNEDDSTSQVLPGTYFIEMNLNSVLSTKGVHDNQDFDTQYSYDYIYLHRTENEESLYFPVYDNCPNPNQEGINCKGFRYRLKVEENGNTTITPINADGSYSEQSLTLNDKEEYYFSSWPTNEWTLRNDEEVKQISSEHWADDPQNPYYFYYRYNEVNKEIYRSENNLTLLDLQSNGDLWMKRPCAGFNVIGLFYDSNSKTVDEFDPSNVTYEMDPRIFSTIMNSSPEEWYIKIYIGGSCYPDSYNIKDQTSQNNHPNGYYSSGDGNKFENGALDNQIFLPFSGNNYSTGKVKYKSYGYYTRAGNHLFTPVTENEKVNIYILIKHWTEEGTPSDEWLKSDIGALQTTIAGGATVTPINGNFYTLGVIIDLTQFKAAWEKEFGEGSTASGTTTRSLSGAPVREVTIPGAKVICDVY